MCRGLKLGVDRKKGGVWGPAKLKSARPPSAGDTCVRCQSTMNPSVQQCARFARALVLMMAPLPL